MRPLVIPSRAWRALCPALSLLLPSCVGGGPSPQPSLAADLALVDVQVVDVRAGEVLPGMTVLVDGELIVAIAPAAAVEVPADAAVVEGRGRYLIPGLWDLHVHTLWDASLTETFLPLFVANGVTGVRDMGGVPELAADWPGRVASGELFGPRIVSPGPILDGDPPLHAEVSRAIDGPEAGRQAVRQVRDEGFAFAKVYTLLGREAYFAMADEANRLDFPFAGHPSGYVTPIEASEAGQLSIEHLAHGQPEGARIDLACVDGDGCGELLETFARNRTWQVPTLVMLRAKAYSEEARYAEDSRLRYVPSMVRADYMASRARRLEEGRPEVVGERREDWRRNSALVGLMATAGVPIGAGTDTGVLFSLPGFSLHDELSLLVEAGLSPAAALRAATSSAAELLGIEAATGAVEVGLGADLVLLRENPLADIGATTSIEVVIRAGELLDRKALDELLAGVARAAVLD